MQTKEGKQDGELLAEKESCQKIEEKHHAGENSSSKLHPPKGVLHHVHGKAGVVVHPGSDHTARWLAS